MLEQQGSFSGLYTCNHVEFRHFEKYSQLRFDVERRAIYNRFDINAHLNVLCNNNIISEFQASDMREDDDNLCSNKSLKNFYRGGTYITLEAAMSYQQEGRDISITVIING